MNAARTVAWLAAAVQTVLALALLAWMRTALGVTLAVLLLLPLPGLLRQRRRPAAAAILLLTFYVGGLLAEGYARPDRQAMAFGLAALAALDFLLLITFVRLQGRRDRAASAARMEG